MQAYISVCLTKPPTTVISKNVSELLCTLFLTVAGSDLTNTILYVVSNVGDANYRNYKMH